MRPAAVLVGALLSGIAIAGCSVILSTEGLNEPEGADSQADTGADFGGDAQPDTARDTSDGGADAAADLGDAVQPDSVLDASDSGIDAADVVVLDAPPDATLDTPPDATVDTASDATSDAKPDAASDVMVDADAGDGRFCNAVDASFCEDFDDDAALAARFTVLDISGGVLAKSVTGPAVSAPGALSAQIGTGAGYLTAMGFRTFAGAVAGVEVDFDAYLQKRGTEPTPLAIQCAGGAAGPPALYLQVLPLEVQVLEEIPVSGGTSFTYKATSGARTVPDGSWIHVRVVLDTKGRKATLEIDGLLLTTVSLDASWIPSQTMVGFGQAGGTGTSTFIDNVVIRLK